VILSNVEIGGDDVPRSSREQRQGRTPAGADDDERVLWTGLERGDLDRKSVV